MPQYDPSNFIKDNYNQYLNNLIDNRKNVHKFSDKIPDKTIITKLLNETLYDAPVKNNIYHYSIEVFGPEHYEAKKALLLQTICGGWSLTKSNHNSLKDIKLTKETMNILSTWDLESLCDEFQINIQVLAPYLLVYKYNKDNYIPYGRSNPAEADNFLTPTMQASMHAIVLSLKAQIYDIDHGFCRCYKQIDNHKRNTVYNYNESDLIFFLGLGYEDENQWRLHAEQNYKTQKPKPNQIYKWM